MRYRSFLLVALNASLLLTAAGCGDDKLDGMLPIDPDHLNGDGDDDEHGDGDHDEQEHTVVDHDASTGDGDHESVDAGNGDGDGDGDGDSGASRFPTVADFEAPGPFETTTGPSPAGCTIHRPTSLGAADRLHPVILWGNGTGTTPSIYGGVLKHWASHGFIAAAAKTSNAGTGQEMLACLDYLEQQHAKSDNPYSGKVDLNRVGASGHSQGGAGAIMAGADARVIVTAPLQPYINFIPGGGAFDSGSITSQRGPMFLMSGENDSVAVPGFNQKPVFDKATVQVFWGTLKEANHTVTAIGNINGYRGPATAWFRLHLMNDESARGLFYGSACELCSDPMWTVMKDGF